MENVLTGIEDDLSLVGNVESDVGLQAPQEERPQYGMQRAHKRIVLQLSLRSPVKLQNAHGRNEVST